MKHEISIISIKQIHHRALKDISEVLEQNYITQNYITNSKSCMALSKGVYRKDDCGKIKSKDSNHTRRSKQNTYHVVNKNIASSKVTNIRRRKRGCLLGHPQA